MRIPECARRDAAPRLMVCALTALAIGFLSMSAATGSAAAAGPTFAPGYCPAPARAGTGGGASEAEQPPWGEFSISTVGRSVQTAVFVDCVELEEWRRGDRERFSVYGAVTLYQGAPVVAKAFPTLAALVEEPHESLSRRADAAAPAQARYEPVARTLAPRGLVQERIADGMLFRTRLLEKGAALPAEPSAAAEGDGVVARADQLTLYLSGATLSADGAAAIERSIVMPYRGDDSLRYLQASLLAGVSADRLTLLTLP